MLIAFTVLFFAPYYLTCLYIIVDPPISAFMLRQALAGRGAEYEWRDLDRISPNLVIQVIAAEDGRYCSHWGVDWSALDAAADAFAEGRAKGGGSTISMQAAKNLFLWNRPAFLRKPIELPLATYMDFVLGKQRLMEIYLNIVEWAPGVYGAEAAARHHFGKSAEELDPAGGGPARRRAAEPQAPQCRPPRPARVCAGEEAEGARGPAARGCGLRARRER